MSTKLTVIVDNFPHGGMRSEWGLSILAKTIRSFRDGLGREDFDAMPFINADGYHGKNIAYSLWHIFRIEDIDALYAYIKDVKISTEKIVRGLPYDCMKLKIPDERRNHLESLNVVSSDKNAISK